MTADLVKRLRIKGPQGDEKSNHLFRRLHIERVEAAARIESLEAELAAERERSGKLGEALSKEEKSHEQTITQRDIAENWADRLAYAIGGDTIGEHSSANNPWSNALDIEEQRSIDALAAYDAVKPKEPK